MYIEFSRQLFLSNQHFHEQAFIAENNQKRFGQNKNVTEKQRILSVNNEESSVLAWSLRAIIFWGEAIVKAKRNKTFVFTLHKTEKHRFHHSGGSITIYKAHFERLIALPKPTRDQLIIRLPADMGLRSGEVATLRIENIDLATGDLIVLDSKKYEHYPVPLTYDIARLIEELNAKEQRNEGWLILQDDRVTWRRGPPMTTVGLCTIWHKWARKAGIPDWNHYNPTLGRHYFACWWHYIKKGSIEVLRRILRHSSLPAIERYLNRLIFYEDVKAEMQRLQNLPIRKNQEGCDRIEICKFYEPVDGGCKFESICKHYQEVQTT